MKVILSACKLSSVLLLSLHSPRTAELLGQMLCHVFTGSISINSLEFIMYLLSLLFCRKKKKKQSQEWWSNLCLTSQLIKGWERKLLVFRFWSQGCPHYTWPPQGDWDYQGPETSSTAPLMEGGLSK